MTNRNDHRGVSLTLERLVKRYGVSDAAAVDDVSLEVEPGEFITFLGPSGSGKTTTLNMIAGFTQPTSGQLILGGEAITRLPPHKRDIGMVFQHYALFPHMTAAQNIAYPLRQRKIKGRELHDRVAGVLETVRLESFGDRYPRELSGGQQQRVALARALVFGPKLLLMDEPLGALDKKLREWLQLEIRRIHRELGITFIYVTHDQDEALALSDRIAVFNHGKIEQLGSAEDLYQRPSSLFVAEFVGDSNVFRGTVTAKDHGFMVGECGRFRLPPGAAAQGSGVLVVRPQHLMVGGEVTEGLNVVDAQVDHIIYLGSERRLELIFNNNQRGQLRERSDIASRVREKERIRVSWRAEHGVLLMEAPDAVHEAEPVPVT